MKVKVTYTVERIIDTAREDWELDFRDSTEIDEEADIDESDFLTWIEENLRDGGGDFVADAPQSAISVTAVRVRS